METENKVAIDQLRKEIDKIKLEIKTVKQSVRSKQVLEQVLEIDVRVNGFSTDIERLKMLDRVLSAKSKQDL